MILWRNYHFLSFYTNPRFPPFLLYVMCKSGVTFVRRCFRDGKNEHRNGFSRKTKAQSSLTVTIFIFLMFLFLTNVALPQRHKATLHFSHYHGYGFSLDFIVPDLSGK